MGGYVSFERNCGKYSEDQPLKELGVFGFISTTSMSQLEQDIHGPSREQSSEPVECCDGRHGQRTVPRRLIRSRLMMYFTDPRRSVHKYFVFFLACCFIPGPYFHDTLVCAYKKQICAAENLDISSTEFSWLIGIPSLMGMLSGPMASIIARWGDARSSFVSGSVTFVASIGVTVAMHHRWFGLVLAFRLVFWLGLYLLMAVQMIVVYKLFEGPELTVAMGFVIFGCRGGGMFGFLSSGSILKLAGDDVSTALWFSVVLVGVATISTSLFACLRGGTTVARTILPLLESRRTATPQNGEHSHPENGENECSSPKGFRAEIHNFSKSTWLLVLQIALMYSVIFPFEAVETEFLEEDWNISVTHVGMFTALGAVFGLFAWVWGLCITSTKALLRATVVAWTALALGFAVLILRKPDMPVLAGVGVGLFGFAFSYLSTATWILIPCTFKKGKDCSPTAVSMSYVAMSVGMFVSNLAAGIIRDMANYGFTLCWFLGLAIIGIWISLRLNYAMRRDDADADATAVAPGTNSGTQVDEVDVTMHSSFTATAIAAAVASTCEKAFSVDDDDDTKEGETTRCSTGTYRSWSPTALSRAAKPASFTNTDPGQSSTKARLLESDYGSLRDATNTFT